MQKLYGHDPELHHLMTAVKLLRDETALLRHNLETYVASGLDLAATAGEAYAEELTALGHRAEDKGVLLPEEPSEAADMLGDVLSIEARFFFIGGTHMICGTCGCPLTLLAYVPLCLQDLLADVAQA